MTKPPTNKTTKLVVSPIVGSVTTPTIALTAANFAVSKPASPSKPDQTKRSTKTFAISDNRTSGIGRKIVNYGASGSGKTTLSTGAPSPIFIDLEGSTIGLNVKLIEGVETFEDLREATRQSIKLIPEGGTLVIDTVSKVDELMASYLLDSHGKNSVKQLGYDRFPCTVETFRLFLADLDPLIRAGRNVVLNAHTAIISYKNATGDDYRQEGPKLTHSANDSCRDQLNAWADFIFNIKYEDMQVVDTQLVGEKGNQRRVGKITGGNSSRVIYTTGTASLIAKSRPIDGKHLPPIVAFSSPTDFSLWTMLLNPETIPQEETNATN